MSISNVSTVSPNQPITPPGNTPICGSAAAAAVAATVLVPEAAAAPLPPPSLAAEGRISRVSTGEQAISLSPEFNKTLFEFLPDEMIVSMLMKLSVKEIVRMREVDTRFRDIGREALAKKISDENIPLAKLGLEGNAKVLAFLLKSLGPENCIRIKQLNLSGTDVDDDVLAELSNLTPNLQSLNLAGCFLITGHGLQHLARLTQLQHLNLLGCLFINDVGLKNLTSLTQLRNLNLTRCALITGAGLQHLARLTKLRSLDLAYCHKINKDSLKNLTSLTQLQNLNLRFCNQITDDGLYYLASLIELQELCISGCLKITGKGLAYLTSLTKLRILNLEGCVSITVEAESKLKSSIPGLTVIS